MCARANEYIQMNYPIRKNIRLPNYDYSSNSAYFITICTYNRSILFDGFIDNNKTPNDSSAEYIIVKWLHELERKYINLKLDMFVIMPDHIHFIIFNKGTFDQKTGAHVGAPLHEIVKWYKTQTTNEYIRYVKHGILPAFDKHIWQRGYYEHIIRNEQEYYDICRYISENPMKWYHEHNTQEN